MDVSCVYLNGNIDEEIYMQVPEHLEIFLQLLINKNCTEDVDIRKQAKQMLMDLKRFNGNGVCKLQKVIYGLIKQSGRQ